MIIKGQFSVKTYVMGILYNHFGEAILMSTQILWRNKHNYPLIIIKYPPYLFHCCNPGTKHTSDASQCVFMPQQQSETD